MRVGFIDYRQQVQLFRLAKLRGIGILPEPYVQFKGFDLTYWLAQSFGTRRDEPVDVKLCFVPYLAADAHQFRFHPNQRLTGNPDRSVIISFTVCGVEKMGRHLFRSDDLVRILAPDVQRKHYGEMPGDAGTALDPPGSR